MGNGVVGFNNQVSGAASGNGVAGDNNQASGLAVGNGVSGQNNQASGFATGNGVTGSNNIASGAGSGNGVNGSNNVALGTNAGNGPGFNNAVAIGTNAQAGESSVAIGRDSFAAGPGDTAVGQGAKVYATSGNSFGNGATVNAGHVNSTAVGTNASTTFDNQVMLGNSTQTYTTPGITSQLSRNRQQGPLEVVTSDAAGNLATDGGSIFERLDEAESGIALAISLENPDLVAGEKFGVAMNVGFYEGAEALGFAAQGVAGYNVFSEGDRVTFSGAVGVGFENGRGDSTVGGRVGGQITWR